MTLGRREFLQRLGVALAALGAGDAAFAGLCGSYQQALARPSRRLALLVGINQYPDSIWQEGSPADKGSLLQGALMDVELQKELLIHRFGVPPADILTLVDAKATRQGILEAIQGHLAEQVRPGDTVVFHFSGLGSQVHLAGSPEEERLSTLVTVDSKLPNEDNPVIQDLFEETLAKALENLQGARVITFLDASSTAPHNSPLQGNFRVRSRLTVPTGKRQPEGDILPGETAINQRSASWPGLLLRASKLGMPALEGNWNGFSAGVFTYALTQQIWSSFPSQRQEWIFRHAERTMETWTGANVSPQIEGDLLGKSKSNLLVAEGIPRPAATGIVKKVDLANKSTTVWLGGLPASLLPYCSLGLVLRPLPVLPGLAAQLQGSVSVKTVKGLNGKAELIDVESLPIGTPLVEIERRLPRDISLCVALDPTLERIERVDATSALAALSHITTTAPGERQADCLFGQLNMSAQPANGSIAGQSQNGSKPDNSASTTVRTRYGLFSPDHTLISGTVTEEEEAVKTAVGRLSEPLRNLLAIKILRLTVNSVSSQLPVRFGLEAEEATGKSLTIEETLRSRQFSGADAAQDDFLTFGSSAEDGNRKFRIQLLNLGQQPLYYLVISVEEKGRISVYCPPIEDESAGSDDVTKLLAETSQLSPDGTLKLPKLEGNSLPLQQLRASEIFAIACTRPFYETWKFIRMPEFRQMNDQLASIPNPLSMAQALLSDLNRASMAGKSSQSSGQETVFVLNSDVWATLSVRSPIQE